VSVFDRPGVGRKKASGGKGKEKDSLLGGAGTGKKIDTKKNHTAHKAIVPGRVNRKEEVCQVVSLHQNKIKVKKNEQSNTRQAFWKK